MVRRSRTIRISLRLLSPIRSPRSKHRALEDRGRTECRQQLVLRQAELSTENAGWRMIAPDAARALSQRPSLALRASNWFASTVSCQHPALRTIGGRPCERARPRSVGNVECRLGGRRLGHLVETGEAVQRLGRSYRLPAYTASARRTWMSEADHPRSGSEDRCARACWNLSCRFVAWDGGLLLGVRRTEWKTEP